MGRVTWPVRVTYLPPLSLGAYKSGLSPHLGAPSGSSSGPVTASAHRVVSRHGMSRQDYAASEPDADGGYLQITVAPRREAAKLPRGLQLQLLTSNAPRSEHDPANIVMHPVTGTFADPMHESAFAAQFFRLAFPCHAFLMVLLGACMAWIGPCLCPRSAWSVAAMLGLVSRVLVHRMDDTVRGQRIGAWTWTLLTVLAFTSDMYGLLTNPATCGQIDRLLDVFVLVSLVHAVVNGSHGIIFVHKVALCGLMLVECLAAFVVCPSPPPPSPSPPSLCAMVAFIICFVLAHMAEMPVRHSYAEKERLAEATTWKRTIGRGEAGEETGRENDAAGGAE